MNKKQENITWFNTWSETYDRYIFRRLLWYWQDKTIAEIPKQAKDILEIGCGTGIGTEKVAQQFRHSKITAIDLSQRMVQKARQRLRKYKTVRIRTADVEQLPFKQEFDAVFTTEAFHHFSEPKKAVKEMARVTKKNGTIIITDINIPPLFIANILFRLEPGFVHLYSKREMKELFSAARIQGIKQKRTGLLALMTKGKKE